MSILVKGMKMPICCTLCPFLNRHSDYCNLQSKRNNGYWGTDFEKWWDELKKDCPLIELPPHSDLIDRDETVEAVDNLAGYGLGIYDAIDYIQNAWAVIESEGEE